MTPNLRWAYLYITSIWLDANNLELKSFQEHRFYCFAFDRNVELEYKKETSGITSFFLKFEKTV